MMLSDALGSAQLTEGVQATRLLSNDGLEKTCSNSLLIREKNLFQKSVSVDPDSERGITFGVFWACEVPSF